MATIDAINAAADAKRTKALKAKAAPGLTLEQVLGTGMVLLTDMLPAFSLSPKQFEKGSYGLAGNGKCAVKLGDLPGCSVDTTLNVVVIHSKPDAEKEPDCLLEDVHAMGTVMLADVLVGQCGEAKQFSTGSWGWGVNCKVAIPRKNNTPVRCQVTGNIVVTGSKPEAK